MTGDDAAEASDPFARALALHRAGRPAEALEAYLEVLTAAPDHADALHLAGVATLQLGDAGRAEALLRAAAAAAPDFADVHFNRGNALKALGRLDEAAESLATAGRLRPDYADAHFNLGNTLVALGRTDEAADAFRRAVGARPDHADAHSNLAFVLNQLDRPEEAEAACRRAVALKPGAAHAHNNLGIALTRLGRADEAAAAFHEALDHAPDFVEACYNLGEALHKAGRPDEAAAAYARVVDARPDFAEAHNNLGVVLAELGRPGEAAAAYRRAIAIRPDFAEAHNNLGNALVDMDDPAAAVAAFEQALALCPGYAEAQTNLGGALQALGRVEDAVAAHRLAVAADPDFAGAHKNLGVALLLAGDYRQGWAEYEWRWETDTFRPWRRHEDRPRWDGGDPNGRTLLVHDEQGAGDAIQFVRYVPLLRDRGARVVVECDPRLTGLFRDVDGAAEVVARGAALPPFDACVALMSLPGLMDTTVDTIPAGSPYLTADPDRVAAWRQRLGEGGGLRVGLAWAGNPIHPLDRTRSMPARHLARLLAVEGVRFVSLQVDERGAELADLPAGAVRDVAPLIDDFADTAALVSVLDLVISVDTAVVHLAGALGRPVWVLLAAAPDWRWLRDREDSPWYPTARLFRQPMAGDWDSVMDRVAAALAARAAG